jgi:MurNAc alpha-1-phosphate uridylyltransferase
MLFAAGFGTRMKHLTQDRPKPLLPVAGRPLLDHALDLTDGLRTRVVNAHYHGDQIADHLAGTDIHVVQEQPDILDTGGGVRNALPILGDAPVFTLNTDAVWLGPNGMDILRQHWAPDQMDALMLCVPLERAVGRLGAGDFSLQPDGQLIWKGDIVYTGLQIIKTDLLHEIPEKIFSLKQLWIKMSERGRLFGTIYPGHWCDVGHPEGIHLAEEMLNV